MVLESAHGRKFIGALQNPRGRGLGRRRRFVYARARRGARAGGQSGCGKTTLALSLLKLLPDNGRITGENPPGKHRSRSPHRRGDPPAALAPPVGHLPGGDEFAPSRLQDRRSDPRSARGLRPEYHARAIARPHRRALPPGRPGSGPGGALPARVLGRNAPAGGDRARAGVQPRTGDRRRTDHRAGCDRPGFDPARVAEFSSNGSG